MSKLDELMSRPSAASLLRRRIAGEGSTLLDDSSGQASTSRSLLDEAEQPAQQAAPPRDPLLGPEPSVQDAPDQQGGLVPASAEENQQARVFMTNIRNTLYDTMADKVMVRLRRGKENVPLAVGDLAAELMYNEVASAQMAQMPLSQGIMMDLGAELVNELYTIADAIGVWQPSDPRAEQKDQSTSLNYAAQKFVHMAVPAKLVDPGQIVQAGDDVKSGLYNDATPTAPTQGATEVMA